MEASKDLKEKRKHPRVSVNLPLEYRLSDSPKAHGGLVINASESGLLVHSIKDLPIGTKLSIAVMFPHGFELANFEVLAEIVWKDINWGVNWQGYDFGLRFIQIHEEDQQKLKQLLTNGHDL